MPLLEPVYLDELYEKKLHNNCSRGYDVWGTSLKYPASKGAFIFRALAVWYSDLAALRN